MEYSESTAYGIGIQREQSHSVHVETPVDYYNLVVDNYNGYVKEGYQLQPITKSCCDAGCCGCGNRGNIYWVFFATACQFIIVYNMHLSLIILLGFLIFFAFIGPLWTGINYFICISLIKEIYYENLRRDPNPLSKFIYYPELCGNSNNKFYSLNVAEVNNQKLRISGHDINVEANQYNVKEGKFSFMVHNRAYAENYEKLGQMIKERRNSFLIQLLNIPVFVLSWIALSNYSNS